MTSLFAFFTLALLIYDCASMAILEPVKPSSPPALPPGSPAVNCSTRLRKTINPSLMMSSDVSRLYPSPKIGASTLPENDHVDNVDKLLNCSDPEISVVPIGEYNEWKNVVVMGCTLAVALEILIVLVMVVFWQQIRWTLRKITCPCDVTRRQSRRHDALRRRSDTGAGDMAVNQETNMDDATSMDSRSSLDGPERGEASQWGTEMQIYEPTTSGAFNGSFVHRSDDDDDGSDTDDERKNPRYDYRRKSGDRESTSGGFSVMEKDHGSAYLDAYCFAQSSVAHGEEEYENEDGGETSGGRNNFNDANSFANNFRDGDEAANAAKCLNNPNENEFFNVGERIGSKKGKESARSHRKGGGLTCPIPSKNVALSCEMTPLNLEKF